MREDPHTANTARLDLLWYLVLCRKCPTAPRRFHSPGHYQLGERFHDASRIILH